MHCPLFESGALRPAQKDDRRKPCQNRVQHEQHCLSNEVGQVVWVGRDAHDHVRLPDTGLIVDVSRSS